MTLFDSRRAVFSFSLMVKVEADDEDVLACVVSKDCPIGGSICKSEETINRESVRSNVGMRQGDNNHDGHSFYICRWMCGRGRHCLFGHDILYELKTHKR